MNPLDEFNRSTKKVPPAKNVMITFKNLLFWAHDLWTSLRTYDACNDQPIKKSKTIVQQTLHAKLSQLLKKVQNLRFMSCILNMTLTVIMSFLKNVVHCRTSLYCNIRTAQRFEVQSPLHRSPFLGITLYTSNIYINLILFLRSIRANDVMIQLFALCIFDHASASNEYFLELFWTFLYNFFAFLLNLSQHHQDRLHHNHDHSAIIFQWLIFFLSCLFGYLNWMQAWNIA